MPKIEMFKAIGEGIVSVGVTAIVYNLVRATTPASAQPLMKGCIAIGSWVLTDMVSDLASTHTENKINKFIDQFKEVIKTTEVE